MTDYDQVTNYTNYIKDNPPVVAKNPGRCHRDRAYVRFEWNACLCWLAIPGSQRLIRLRPAPSDAAEARLMS